MAIDALVTDYLITELAHKALDAFWEVVARHFPSAKTGDLSIDRTISLQSAAESAISEWIANNVQGLK